MGKRERKTEDPEDERAEPAAPDAPSAPENAEMTADQAETEIARERDEFSRAVDADAGTFAEETAQDLERIEESGDALLPEERAASEAISREADAAQVEFTQAVDAENRESKEGERTRRIFEYRDAEGRLLGSAEIELDPEEVALDEMTIGKKEAGKGRALKLFVLRGEKDGKPTTVDVMAMINPHGAEILVASSRLDNYSYNNDRKRATVPMPETPLDIGVVMHELGHADQHHEERFAPVSPLYSLGKSAKADAQGSLLDMKEKIETVIAAVPEAAAMVDPETLREIEGMQKEKEALWEKRDALADRLGERTLERSRILNDMLDRAVTAALPEGFAKEVMSTFDELSDTWDEKKWTDKAAEYVEVLERTGFRFAEVTPPPEPETPSGSHRFLDILAKPEAEKPKTPLPKDKLTGLDAVTAVVNRFKKGVSAEKSVVSYSPEDGTLRAEIPFPNGSGFWDHRLDLELPMSAEEHAAYAAARETADAGVATAEKELADATEAVAAAGRSQKERVERSNLADIIKLPMRMLERDATRRAYQWIRKIRQDAGVDLFAAHKAQNESTLGGIREARLGAAKDEDCESSTEAAFDPAKEEWVETDVIENLDEGLKSYGAEHPPLKKRGT